MGTKPLSLRKWHGGGMSAVARCIAWIGLFSTLTAAVMLTLQLSALFGDARAEYGVLASTLVPMVVLTVNLLVAIWLAVEDVRGEGSNPHLHDPHTRSRTVATSYLANSTFLWFLILVPFAALWTRGGSSNVGYHHAEWPKTADDDESVGTWLARFASYSDYLGSLHQEQWWTAARLLAVLLKAQLVIMYMNFLTSQSFLRYKFSADEDVAAAIETLYFGEQDQMTTKRSSGSGDACYCPCGCEGDKRVHSKTLKQRRKQEGFAFG